MIKRRVIIVKLYLQRISRETPPYFISKNFKKLYRSLSLSLQRSLSLSLAGLQTLTFTFHLNYQSTPPRCSEHNFTSIPLSKQKRRITVPPFPNFLFRVQKKIKIVPVCNSTLSSSFFVQCCFLIPAIQSNHTNFALASIAINHGPTNKF